MSDIRKKVLGALSVMIALVMLVSVVSPEIVWANWQQCETSENKSKDIIKNKVVERA